jgi:hypothetical protein
MRAADRCEMRSEGVTVHGRTALTCRYIILQRVCRVVRSVRIEGVRGSNPLSSTEFFQVTWLIRVSGSRLGSHRGNRVAESRLQARDNRVAPEVCQSVSGRVRGSPKRVMTLVLKQVMAVMWSPAVVMTRRQ